MKITLELPDWAADRHISIMAGVELVAYIPRSSLVALVKEVRCNNCGWCCLDKHVVPYDCASIKVDSVTTNKFICELGPNRPWLCSWSDPVLTKHPEGPDRCCIRYKEVEF